MREDIGYSDLASAIIKQAIRDLSFEKKGRGFDYAKDSEIFLESEWCDELRKMANHNPRKENHILHVELGVENVL